MAKSNTVSNLVAQLIGSPMFNLSLSSKELFHSNFLAWLGNNSSTRDFFAAVINDLIPGLQLSATGRWTVEREEKHFDLSIKDGNNYLAVIENKVKSVPMAKQLEKYATFVEDFQNNNNAGQSIQCPLLLLTLMQQFPDRKRIEDEHKWTISGYADLAEAMRTHLAEVKNPYPLTIIHDYINFIEALTQISNEWSILDSDTFLYDNSNDGKVDKMLNDLREKIRFCQIYMHLEKMLHKYFANLVILSDFKKDCPKCRDKLYIFLNWGFTNSSGLLDIAVPITTDDHPKLYYGSKPPRRVVKIQIQGGSYRHVLEDFESDKGLKDLALSDFFTSKLKYFCNYDDKTASKNVNYGYTSLFEVNTLYPVKKVTNWPFASFTGKTGLFLYQSRHINDTATIERVLSNVISEIKRVLSAIS